MIEMSEQINELATALARAQMNFKAVPKTKTAKVPTKSGGEYSYKYADLADAFDACRTVLADNNLSVVQAPAQLERGVCTVTTMLIHSSGQWMRSALALDARDATPQSIGSVITYARRYGLAAMIGLVTDDDTDAQEHQPARGNSGAQAGQPNGRASYSGTTRGEGGHRGRPAEPPPAPAPQAQALANTPPATAQEAEQRFFARYGEAIGGANWQAVQRYLGHLLPRPTSVEEWTAAADEVRRKVRQQPAAAGAAK